MYECENRAMSPEEELVEILLDFIIVAANLSKSINRTMKENQIREGDNIHGKVQRNGIDNQKSAQCGRCH